MLKSIVTTVSLAALVVGCIEHPTSSVGGNLIAVYSAPAIERGSYSWTQPRQIPDNDSRGILLGPLVTRADGDDLGPVILRLDIRHSATVDLAVRLAYDADGDGKPEIQVPIEFYRSRADVRAQELYACPQSLNGSYFFRDGTGDEPVLAVLQALPPGRAFYLAVADTLPGETGTVLGWSVQLDRSKAFLPAALQ